MNECCRLRFNGWSSRNCLQSLVLVLVLHIESCNIWLNSDPYPCEHKFQLQVQHYNDTSKLMIYEGEEEAISMFENNSTSIGYTHTCSEIRII